MHATTARAFILACVCIGVVLTGIVVFVVAAPNTFHVVIMVCSWQFVDTSMLCLAVGCSVLSGFSEWAVTSLAWTLMVSIYALGGVSGVTFSPIVSLARGITKQLE